MRGFELYDATTVRQAVDLLQTHAGRNVKVVGGGSDLVGGVMKDWVQGKGMALPEVLIDITTIKDINGIRLDGGGTTIGAATTLTDIIEHKDLGAKLQPGGAAVFVLVRQSTPDKVLPRISQYGGDVIHSSLSQDAEETLQEALRPQATA